MKLIAKEDRLKTYHAKSGYNKLFGMDVDVRTKMNHEELTKRFDEVWNDQLQRAILRAEKCDPEDAKRKINDASKKYFVATEEHREFWLENGLFIAQLKPLSNEDAELTQLWFVRSSDIDPKVLYIRFSTAAEREEFHKLAEQLQWPDEELGKRLVLNFMELALHKSFGKLFIDPNTPARQKSEVAHKESIDSIAEKYGL